jgi:Flp pilus assembly protein TadG
MERGQVLVIFAGAMIAFMMLMAMVVDVGWYWSSGLKIQRAADAAALAGAVWLPETSANTGQYRVAALAAAKRNGYVPDSDTSITTTIDAGNARQLDVTINDKVGTFFLKVVGIQTLNASKSSKAEFVLPVPMGSPLNYYGVGTYVGMTTPTVTTNYTNPSAANANPSSGWAIPSAVGPTVWSSPTNAYTSNNSYSTYANNNNNPQVWKSFNFGSFASGALIDGFQVALELKDTDASGCQVKVETSWNGGANWSNLAQQTSDITTSDAFYTLGNGANDGVWDSVHSSWSPADFSAANFQVRLTYVKGAACSGTVSLDQVAAVVYSHTSTQGTPAETTQPVAKPIGFSTSPASQGFWGAVITKGGDRSNGDQFDPANNGGSANPDYNGLGIDYNVVITGTAGQVQIFDPTFCETGLNSSGSGHYGAGDHWISGGGPVTTVYTLFNQNGTPYDIHDDTQVATSGNLFANENQSDQSGAMGSPTTGVTDCSTINSSAIGGYYHNKWYQLATGLAAGTYRLNVSTNSSNNNSTNAENGWSLLASSTGGTAQVYGQGQMVAYTNLISGTSRFYLAQIDKVHAGKTLEIHVFDPDSMTGTMRILSPDSIAGNTQTYLNFSWTADNGQSGTNVNSIAITPNGFNDVLVTIAIPLPTTYGSSGLWQNGWWQIEYNVGGGNDTTTWSVDIRGNPVHLLVP